MAEQHTKVEVYDRETASLRADLRSGRRVIFAFALRFLLAIVSLLPFCGAQGGVIFTNLFAFDGTNGSTPVASLVQGSDGCFYGTTAGGGTYGFGTVFKMNTNGILTTLYDFGQITNTNDTYSPLDGAGPYCTLAQGSNGNFYGTTVWGGTNNGGTVFEITTTGSLTTLYSFTGGADGFDLKTGLAQGSDGNFYGVTDEGGTNDYGTAFKIATNGTFTVLHDFTGLDDGESPYTASLVLGSDGNLYGATLGGGGVSGVGTVFKMTEEGTLTTLYTFIEGFWGGTNGSNPKAGLVQGRDGNFYGTTQHEGTNGIYGVGTVFAITTNGDLTTLANFDGANGEAPMAPLIQGADGNFYGTTSEGGTNDVGTAFRITPGGMLTSLYSFTNPTGSSGFLGGLVQGRDGGFYGVLPFGGVNGAGTVYRLTIVAPSAPSFQSISQTNGILSLTWSAEVGATYQVQYNCDLSSTNWTNLGGAITATGTSLSITDSDVTDPRRFYRVAVLP